MKKKIDRNQVNYFVDNNGTMTVFYGRSIVMFEVSDCKKMSHCARNRLIDEALAERDYVW